MAHSALLLLLVAVVALSFAPRVAAFGAGNIPSYSYLEDKAFRDIEDIIVKLAQAAGGGLFSRGKKFSPLDVKRVYFGNWLRDYSQAVDVGALKKVPLQTVVNIVMVLGFLAHGYVTGEFEVTQDNLGCYLPTEHIDNPKGYADGEDARQYDPRLRGPVDPAELQIDELSGMKNYIANEAGNWDTSSKLIKRRLQECIDLGRIYRQSGEKKDLYQAFQLLGRTLHTLEDFTAHSNWCELALIQLGHHEVFPHVGSNVKIRTRQGKDVYPLVTGTFGGADFIHSLLGETTDHLSQASVSDLNKTMNNARSVSNDSSAPSSALRQMLFDIPGDDGQVMSRDMDSISNMRAGQPGGLDPSMMTPQELHATIWRILSFRDSVMKRIENTIDRIPGLASLTEKISNGISVFIITTLEPFVKPVIGQAVAALGQSSQAVIDSHDQYEVWNDWNASDPSHSFLSKDHFNLILNQPAGEIAQVIVEYAVNLVVKAWDEPNMPYQAVIEPIVEALHHPDFRNPHSQIQQMMMDRMKKWLDSTGRDRAELLRRLTPDSVKQGRNKRIGHENDDPTGHVHNSVLPEGGLQNVLASHNMHVPGAQVLNAGQDLLGGKMPWQQGFGSGGQHAWRELDINEHRPTNGPSSLMALEGDRPPQGGYPMPSPQGEPSYNGGGYGGPPATNNYGDTASYGGPPAQQYGGSGPNQWGSSEPQGYGGPPESQGGYGGPPGPPDYGGSGPGYGQDGGSYGGPGPEYGQQGGYGGPPPGQYGGPGPEQGYGGPPGGQWGPPPGQYGEQQGGQWGPPPPQQYDGYGPPGGYR